MDVIQKAVRLVDDGHVEQAMTILSQFLTTCSDDEKFIIAELYMEWGFYDEAKEILEQLLEHYEQNDELKVILSSIYIELEEDEQAIQLLDQIDENSPNYVQALIQQADLYETQGLFEVAEHKLLQAKQIKPDEMIIDFALGELLFSIGDFNRAITFYEKVLQSDEEITHVNVNERMAECLASLGQYEKALSYYERIDEESADILFKHGLVAHYSERHALAIQVWKKLLEVDPYYHTAYVHLGKLLYKEGRYKEAFNVVKKGLHVDDYNKELYLLAAKITYALDDKEESERYVREAIKLDYDYKEAILFLVELLKVENKFDEIINSINEIKEAHVYDPDYEWELAKAYYELEKYDNALTIYQNIKDDLKTNSKFLKEYGYFLVEEGMVNDAIDIFTSYLQLVDDDEDVVFYLERLQRSNDELSF